MEEERDPRRAGARANRAPLMMMELENRAKALLLFE